MFVESSVHLGIKERRVTTLVLQFYPNVAPELIVFREHRYHWDLKTSLMSIPVHEVAVRRTILVWTNIVKIL
jgi:hypothetical protein